MSTRTIPPVVETGEGYEPAPQHRDPRLPKSGTTLKRRIRTGDLLELEVGENFFLYQGASFRTISGATKAACEEHAMKPQNGYLFWGLVKPTRRPAGEREASLVPAELAIVGLEGAWKRYHRLLQAVAMNIAKTLDPQGALAKIDGHQQMVIDLYTQAYDGWAAMPAVDEPTETPAPEQKVSKKKRGQRAELQAEPAIGDEDMTQADVDHMQTRAGASETFSGQKTPKKKTRSKRGVKSRRRTGPVS